ncbi:MAG: hypothetical protein ACM3ZC_09010 [Bacteroidota bacterium]
MPIGQDLPDLDTVRERWRSVIALVDKHTLLEQRWFQGHAAASIEIDLADFIFLPWPHADELVSLNLIGVRMDGGVQDYYLPLILLPERPGLPFLARLTVGGETYVLAEASLSRRVATALLQELARGSSFAGQSGRFVFHPSLPRLVRAVRTLDGDSSNTVLHLHRDEVQKIMRRLWPGLSREVQLGLALEDYPFVPSVHGYLAYERGDLTFTLSVWEEYLPNRGNLWDAMVKGLTETLRLAIEPGQPADPGEMLTLWLARRTLDLEKVALLCAHLHAALAKLETPSPFRPADLEPISARIRTHLAEARAKIPPEPPEIWSQAFALLEHLEKRLRAREQIGLKLETHGDLHLGQILQADEGYAVIDLAGEPLLDPETRASHTTPLRDLAGLIRSFSYAGQAAYLALVAGQRVLPEQDEVARFLVERFADRAAEAVARHYGAAMSQLVPEFLPHDPVAYMDLLDLCRLEKVAYELAYELANRPEWVVIPLIGLRHLLAERARAGIR